MTTHNLILSEPANFLSSDVSDDSDKHPLFFLVADGAAEGFASGDVWLKCFAICGVSVELVPKAVAISRRYSPADLLNSSLFEILSMRLLKVHTGHKGRIRS